MGVVVMSVRRFEVYRVNLDPTQGKEIKKMRPCLVISPDELNRFIATVIVAPMTTKGRDYPSRVSCRFQGKEGQVVLDQIRTVDKSRLFEKLGKIDKPTQAKVLAVLGEMFAP
ncbi:type II toxin-antitoxin system PemK/MazF family toxin [candidate division KSB1 bacterium]|nr:type II toxin-antitoxin system PemK/MazF family toxin [candidate division KSB1 bacterium]